MKRVNEISSSSSVESQLSHITAILNKIVLGELKKQSYVVFVVQRGILLMDVLHFKRVMLMLSF